MKLPETLCRKCKKLRPSFIAGEHARCWGCADAEARAANRACRPGFPVEVAVTRQGQADDASKGGGGV